MTYDFHASFNTLEEMLVFTNKLGKNTAGTSLQTVLERINKMANEEVASVIANMQAGFASLNEAQARDRAATDRLLAMVADFPARLQEVRDAALASGVDAAQIAALTDLQAAVQAEVTEAQAEATRLEAAAPAPAPVNPNPNPEPAPVVPEPTTEPTSDTTGGGEPAPVPPPAPNA